MPDMLVITFMKLVHIVLKHNVQIQEKNSSKSDLNINFFLNSQPNLPLSFNFIVLKALYYFKLGNIIGLLECYCISALAERAAFAIA